MKRTAFNSAPAGVFARYSAKVHRHPYNKCLMKSSEGLPVDHPASSEIPPPKNLRFSFGDRNLIVDPDFGTRNWDSSGSLSFHKLNIR